MKKGIVALLGVTITASMLAGCGSDEPESLVVAARGGSHVAAMEAVKEAFEQEHNVEIEIIGLEAADLKQMVSLDAQNSEGAYDLIMADDPWMPEFGDAGIFANLSELGVEEDQDFVKAALDLGKHPYESGDLHALPFSGNVQLFFYNKEKFENNGYDVPESWEEVLDIARALHEADGTAGYVIRGQQGNPIVSDYLPLFWAYGGQIMDDNWNALVDSEAGHQALATYIELLDVGANYEITDIVSSVSEGRAGMSLGWPSWYISGESASAEYAPIPSKGARSSDIQSTGMIGNWMMGVAANSQNLELAAEFLTFITSSEIQKQMVEHGGVPTRSSVYLDSELSETYKHFPTLLEGLENSVARPRTPRWSQVEEALGAELSAAISGTKSIERALSDANAAINRIMQ